MKEYKVVICGAGISGLSTGFWLLQNGLDPSDLLILESSNRCGGEVETRRVQGNLLEMGPNSIMVKSPRLLEFVKALGLYSEILVPQTSSKKRYLRRGNKLWQITSKSVLSNLSQHSKLRLAALTFSTSAPHDSVESVYTFFCRKIGPQLTNELVVPFVSGIYAGDSRQLIAKQAFPNLVKLEAKYNSLILGSILDSTKSESIDSRYRGLINFRKGLQSLTDKMSEILQESVKCNRTVCSIIPCESDKYQINTELGSFTTKNLVLSIPSYRLSTILEGVKFSSLRKLLKSIDYPSLRVMHFQSNKADSRVTERGFGFLSQQYEESKILGCLWPSHCFGGRCDESKEIHTVFSGGKLYPEYHSLSIDHHSKSIQQELVEVLKMSTKPNLLEYKEWSKAIPQYDEHQLALHRYLQDLQKEQSGLYFSCNYYQGVSVGDCILNGMNTAENITSVLKRL